MKKRLIISILLSFIAGVIISAIACLFFVNKTYKPYSMLLLQNLGVYEEFRSSKARRENNKIEEILHRWNCVLIDECLNDSNKVPKIFINEIKANIFDPFKILVLDKMWKENEKSVFLPAINRGKFANALEEFGLDSLASIEWKKAQSLLDSEKKSEDINEIVQTLLKTEESDNHKAAEDAVIGK